MCVRIRGRPLECEVSGVVFKMRECVFECEFVRENVVSEDARMCVRLRSRALDSSFVRMRECARMGECVLECEIVCSDARMCVRMRGRGGGLGSRPKKMYGERLGDGVEYHLMKPTPRR